MALLQVAVVIGIIAANPTPRPGQIGAIYLDGPGESQVWIDLVPRSDEPGPSLVHINFTLTFPGRQLTQTPATVTVRARTECFAYPTTIRQPTLRFVLDGSRVISPTTPDARLRFVASGCSEGADTIVAQIPFSVLVEISDARDIRVDALGFTLHFTRENRGSVEQFAKLLRGGVAIGNP